MFHFRAGDVLSADRIWSQITELWTRVDQAEVFIPENRSWVQKWKLGPKIEICSKKGKFGRENGSFTKMEIWSRKWKFSPENGSLAQKMVVCSRKWKFGREDWPKNGSLVKKNSSCALKHVNFIQEKAIRFKKMEVCSRQRKLA